MLASLLQQYCCELDDGKQFGNAVAVDRRLRAGTLVAAATCVPISIFRSLRSKMEIPELRICRDARQRAFLLR